MIVGSKKKLLVDSESDESDTSYKATSLSLHQRALNFLAPTQLNFPPPNWISLYDFFWLIHIYYNNIIWGLQYN